MDFLENVKAPPKKYGEKNQFTNWHIIDLTPVLIKIINCSDSSLKQRVKKILSQIYQELPDIIGK